MNLPRNKFFLLGLFLFLVFVILIFIFISNRKEIPFRNKNIQDIIVDNPKENQKIRSPLIIIGKAKGNWFFEAEFRAELYDDNNNLLGKTILTAKKDWMSSDFVPFKGELSFKKPTVNTGKLVFLSANPSGLAENQKVFSISVQFEDISYQKLILYYYNPEKDKDKRGNIKCSEDGLVAIEREIPLGKTPIKDTINLLLKGRENLTHDELNQGIETEFPLVGFELKSVNLKPDETLILEFSDPYNQTSGGSCRAKLLWLQIEKTAKQFPQVKEVKFTPPYLFQP